MNRALTERHSAAEKRRRGAENSSTPTMRVPSGARPESQRLSTEHSTKGRLAKPFRKISGW